MERGRWQSSKSIGKRALRKTLRFPQSAPGDLLREIGSGGNRGRAAAAKKAGFEYASILDPCRQPENVSTDRVADLNCGRCPRKFSGIARMTEVIETASLNIFQKYHVKQESLNLERFSS